jgi:bifunctional enzyme CysN/CysC/sulfate adenylyltransferase subunit 1
MNDIATIELETNSPLFFDAYQLNHTTGSFIVIDPLTNATLAAGMIREDLSESASISTRKEILPAQIPLTPLERYRRHGHYPAVILANARPLLAGQLERVLFEEGFEVMAVEENSSFSSTRNTWAALHAAGFVIIYHNPLLSAEERLGLQSVAGGHFFDLADAELPPGNAEAVERMLALVEPLRIPAQQGKLGKVI